MRGSGLIIATCLWIFTGFFTVMVAQGSWSQVFPATGTFSSPWIADLNGDGTGDVIMGIGRQEFQHCDSAVIALDGKTGELLWENPADDQIFGSAALKDINGDSVPDIFINGRSAELQAIDGKTGKVIWRFNAPDKSLKWKNKRWFNFYDPQFIPDQNSDGYDDILISNGGDVKAEPYDPDRPPGQLVVIDSKNGNILADATVPDGKETYMSVTAHVTEDGKDWYVIFGTGGETIGGSLFVTKLSDIMRGDLSNSIELESSAEKGFIGPPVWADITGDGFPDIIANAVDGRLLAYDGITHQNIWHVRMPDTEAYSSIAPGFFTEDSTPDFLVSYAQGKWPDLDWTKQFMVNGATGKIEYVDSLDFYQTSTPVVADFNQDGFDDALLVVNYQVVGELYQKWFNNMLVYIDFRAKNVIDLGVRHDGHNLSSTPWIGDMDSDGKLDIVFCHSTNNRHTYAFDGMQVNRISTNIPVQKPIVWGSYMGSNYDGIFEQ